MTKQATKTTVKVVDKGGPWGFGLFLGFFGALVYFVDKADGFWAVVVAFFQACVWPAYLVYYGLKALGA